MSLGAEQALKRGAGPYRGVGDEHRRPLTFPVEDGNQRAELLQLLYQDFPPFPQLFAAEEKTDDHQRRWPSLHLLWEFSGCGLQPGQVLAAWRGPGHHVGEAHLVLGGQHGVVHVVELLLGEARQEQTLPWRRRRRRKPCEPRAPPAPRAAGG